MLHKSAMLRQKNRYPTKVQSKKYWDKTCDGESRSENTPIYQIIMIIVLFEINFINRLSFSSKGLRTSYREFRKTPIVLYLSTHNENYGESS